MRRRQQAARAFRAILWGVCLALFIQITWAVALEVGPTERIDPEYAERQRLLLTRLEERPGRPLVLALGSSRTILGLRAGRMTEALTDPPATVFNFGLTGAGPLTQQIVLRRWHARGIRPDVVLIEVLPPFFNAPGGPGVEAFWLKGNRLRACEVATVWPYHARGKRMLTEWGRSRLLTSERNRSRLRASLGLELPGDVTERTFIEDGFGWLGKDMGPIGHADRQRLLAQSHSQYRDAFGPFQPAAVQVRTLREILADCRTHGIPAALYVMPESPSFRAFYPTEQVRDFGVFLDALAREEGVPVVDARAWVGEDGFWDGHHLLPDGAAVFTDRLERAVVRPLLKALPAGSLAAAE